LYDGKLDNVANVDWEKFGTPAILSPDRINKGLLRIVGDKVKTIPVDVVFPVLHGPNGEDGTIQGLCELADILYVGCGVTASSVAMDKATMKLVARALKIPQADFITIGKNEYIKEQKAVLTKTRYKVGYPCFVKPSESGSSIGISKVQNRAELAAALETAFNFSSRAVVEKVIAGREIEVGILGAGAEAKVSVPGEIVADGEFYDFDAKYNKPASKTIVPAQLPEEVVEKVQGYALELFRAIGGKGFSRADFFVTEDNRVIFNEINTVPGFTKISMFAKVWKQDGIERQQLVETLIEMALSGE